MSRIVAVGLAAGVVAVSGCMGQVAAPPRAELTEAPSSAPAHPRLALAVMQSARFQGGGASGEFIESPEVVDMFIAGLRKQFKTVQLVDLPEQASKSGADVVASLEGSFYSPLSIWDESLASLTARFIAPDGTALGTVTGKGRARGSKDTPFGIGQNRAGKAIRIAVRRAIDDFDRQLASLEGLKNLQPGALPVPSPVRPVATAPAPAPAAPAFRSEVENPGYRFPEDESKFALVVGVEKYQAAPVADHATRDARSVRAHLKALGYPERNIVLLTDQQAGKSSLEKYLEAWLPKNTDEKSTVLFYFSGHGAPNPDDQQAYLMPWDGDPKFLENTGYPVKRLYERLNALKAKKVLVAMDACFSGAGGRSVIAKGTRPLVGKVDAGQTLAGRVNALTASAVDETTGADEEAGHGLFTYHLLRALQARQGRASLKTLFDDLSPKVRDAARRDNRDQTPQLIGDGGATL